MKKLLIAIAAALTLLVPTMASADVFSQNQLIIPSFGSGIIISTSTANGGKLQATSSPNLSSIYATSTTATSSIAHLTVGQSTVSTTLNLSFLTGTQCLHEIGGIIFGTGSDCGSGGGGGLTNYDAWTHPAYGGSATTSLMTFTTGGLFAFASSTIGNATQTSGLTINGGATTTLSAYFAANLGIGTTSPGSLLSIGNTGGINFTLATSTWNTTGGIDIEAGCFSLAGTCLQTIIQAATAFKSAANYATNAVLAGTPTYANGSSGVGATLTEVGFGALSVDGAAPSVGQRILVKNQVDQTTNGVYTVTAAGSGIASYVLTRSTDFNISNDIYAGVTVPVLAGTVNAGDAFVQTTTGTIVVGTSNIVFAEASAANGGVASLAQTYGTAQTGALTIASSSTAISNDWGITNVNGAFTIQLPTATASVRGLLSGTDFTTFNAKQAAISATWPITFSANTVGWGGLATSSPIAAASGFLYATGVNTFASIATSSPISMSITGNAGTVTTNANLSGAVVSSGSNVTTFGSTAVANSVLINNTGGAAVPVFTATTSLFAGIANSVLTFSGGSWVGVATSTNSPNNVSSGFTGASSFTPYKIITSGANASAALVASSTIDAGFLSGILGPTVGGTGLNTVTQGDLLYGSASNVWSKLADVATGSYLASGGIGGNPVYTATSTGFPNNVSSGRTGATSFTLNQLIYGNGAAALQSSSNLTFDGTSLSLTGNGTTTNWFSTTASSTNLFASVLGISTTSPWGINFGTTTTMTNASLVQTIASTTATNEAVTQTISFQTGNTQRHYLHANTLLNINATSSFPGDGHYELQLIQDETGSRTCTFGTPGVMRWVGTTPATTTCSVAARSITFLRFDVDKTLGRVYTASTTGTNAY